MYKGECLNPELSKLLCTLGHTDKICVCDAGLPIPKATERIDLAWMKNNPRWLDVCKFLDNNMNIEKILLAKEILEEDHGILGKFKEIFVNTAIEYIDHKDLKDELNRCKAVIRTGEFSSFANCIMIVGVNFKG